MPAISGFAQLQPSFVLGTNQWVCAVAEQMVGAEIDRVNQLRDHFPFYPLSRAAEIVVPRVDRLCTAVFVDPAAPATDDSGSSLSDPPETIDMACLEGSINLADFATEVQSYEINQMELAIEFKKIAIRIAFWEQFFGSAAANGFRGLPQLSAASQMVSLGRILTLADLDALVAGVTEANEQMDRKILVMNTATFVYFAQLVRATGSSMAYATLNGRRYAAHNGVPILLSDYVRQLAPPDGSGADVWCMTLGMEDGGVFGMVPEEVGDSGLTVEEIQGAVDTASTVFRVQWYCTVILGQFRGLAGLTDVQVPAQPVTF